jgi:hypothetical protein
MPKRPREPPPSSPVPPHIISAPTMSSACGVTLDPNTSETVWSVLLAEPSVLQCAAAVCVAWVREDAAPPPLAYLR